ncbi:DNA replication pre-initiation complex subunit Cdc45 [Schizosaccharomyces japonicus yFS275]|uniref:DNA replication pre-initiation complex subunit Cdc45 n=1 Tax=Schizosaccharomyces japonicus (strain yFS275 / FY16936) TaxID=402676 RepID=B6JVC0_SCHJY|nr:DNA replication pre-initiation complex subunit Cdc45 [Schizosaccharomyces japonicus yFS275]EEB05321.2 DNA replication pre-initiation complex subunit Cdc45 [Schizosaccharomyces japonicus yFS275]
MYVKRSEYAKFYSNFKEQIGSGGCPVQILVGLDPDALCACKLLSRLLKGDFITHKILPISGYQALEKANKTLIEGNEELKAVILINCGAMVDLPAYLAVNDQFNVYLIDSHRPYNLDNIYEEDNRIFVIDDGDIEDEMTEIHEAWYTLRSLEDTEETRSQENSSDEESTNEEVNELSGNETDNSEDSIVRPRRRRRYSDNTTRKIEERKRKKEKYKQYSAVLADYYNGGTWVGDSVTNTLYSIASSLGREDNEALWLAIVGLTSLEINSQVFSRSIARSYKVLRDEVNRLNPPPLNKSGLARPHGKSSTDNSIHTEDEFRFMLVRHWSLYDAMLHSSYVGSRLRIWSEDGRKRLHKLLAKMGLSLVECKQTYTHMNMELKKTLKQSLTRFGPLYGLDEVVYQSFIRTFGFKCTLSASDVTYAISALLESGKSRLVLKKNNTARDIDENEDDYIKQLEDEQNEEWLHNFYDAYDSLDNVDAIEKALTIAMSLQRSIVRSGITLLEKRNIKTLRSFRIGLVTEGADLKVFNHPLALTKLTLWVAEAINQQEKEMGKLKHLPLVLAALQEEKDSYLIVGTSTSTFSSKDEDDGHGHNKFGLAFQEVANMTSAKIRMDSFEASVIECKKSDLGVFLESLSLKTL